MTPIRATHERGPSVIWASAQTVIRKERSGLSCVCLGRELHWTLVHSYLEIAFDELCCSDSRLHIETDIYLDPSFMVSELDDGHLRGGGVNTGAHGLNVFVGRGHAGAAQAYCSFVQDFDGMWTSHVAFMQGLF